MSAPHPIAGEPGRPPSPVREVIETQWQFVAGDLASLHMRLASGGELAGFSLVRRAPLDLTDRYLDTADMRLARAGLALRLRSDGVHHHATLKSLSADSTRPKRRRSITQPMNDASIETLLACSGPIADRSLAVAGGMPLESVFTTHTHREVFQALDGDVDAASITLDSTEWERRGDATGERLQQRVEVELHDASVNAVQPLVEKLRESGMLEFAGASKFEIGLAAVGRTLPEAPGAVKPPIDACMGTVAAGQALLRHQLEVWHALEPAVRLGEDLESLHRWRVTGRRLVAVLRLLEAAPLAGAKRLRPRLRALLRRSNALRDLDVQRAEIQAVAETAAAGSLQPVLDELGARRTRQQRAFLRALDSLRIRQLLMGLDRLANRPYRRHSPQLAVIATEHLIRKRFRKARKAVRAVKHSASADNLHAVRLEAKKLRYVAEPFAAVYGAPMKRFLRRLQRLQDLLGDINDAHHSIENLELLVQRRRRALPADALFAMGRVSERQHQRLLRKGDEWMRAWKNLSGKGWRRLSGRMKEVVAEAVAPKA